jgi:hypothetical protein
MPGHSWDSGISATGNSAKARNSALPIPMSAFNLVTVIQPAGSAGVVTALGGACERNNATKRL